MRERLGLNRPIELRGRGRSPLAFGSVTFVALTNIMRTLMPSASQSRRLRSPLTVPPAEEVECPRFERLLRVNAAADHWATAAGTHHYPLKPTKERPAPTGE